MKLRRVTFPNPTLCREAFARDCWIQPKGDRKKSTGRAEHPLLFLPLSALTCLIPGWARLRIKMLWATSRTGQSIQNSLEFSVLLQRRVGRAGQGTVPLGNASVALAQPHSTHFSSQAQPKALGNVVV